MPTESSLKYLRYENQPLISSRKSRRNVWCDGASIALATLNWQADVWVIRPAHTTSNSDGNGGTRGVHPSTMNCIELPSKPLTSVIQVERGVFKRCCMLMMAKHLVGEVTPVAKYHKTSRRFNSYQHH